jgi:hypothetical protein
MPAIVASDQPEHIGSVLFVVSFSYVRNRPAHATEDEQPRSRTPGDLRRTRARRLGKPVGAIARSVHPTLLLACDLEHLLSKALKR